MIGIPSYEYAINDLVRDKCSLSDHSYVLVLGIPCYLEVAS